MRTENKFHYGTVREVAEFLASTVKLSAHGWKFQNCDFAIAEVPAEIPLSRIYSDVEGWYGIKYVDTGFDSTDMVLISDYYGGGGMTFSTIYAGMSKQEMKDCIAAMLVDTFTYNEACDENTMLFVEEVAE